MAKIQHIEIAGTDGARLRSFYADLFEWKIEKRDVAGFDYYDIHHPSELSAGIRHEPEGKAEIVAYVEVPNVAQYVEKAQSLGAKIRIPPMEHDGLRFALIEDPEGNPIGLTEASSG